MGPLIFARFAPLSGPCVSRAAAEPERLQAAVRAAARAGPGPGAGAGAGAGGSGRRAKSQLHLHAQRRGGAAAARLQRRAHRELRRPGSDPQDGEPSRRSPAAAGAGPAGRRGAEPAARQVSGGECVWRPVLSWME